MTSRCPAPMFDDLHPLSSPIPLGPCVEDPNYAALVAELGDPALVDDRVVDLPASAGAVVESDAVVVGCPTDCEPRDVHVVDDAPPTAALSLVRPPRAVGRR